jgi:DNA-binding transcriptional LysR family regulator
MMLNLDHNKLKTFLIVAEHLNFTKAARILGRTQSAVSQQLALLEEELEMMLFERKGGKVLLTKEGQMIYSQVSVDFKKIEDTIHVVRGTPKTLAGKINIGISSSYGHYYLMPLISRFLESFPLATFEIHELRDREIEQRLLANTLEIGFIVTFENAKLLDVFPAFSFVEQFVGSTEYLNQNVAKKATKPGKSLSYENFKKLDLIDFSDDLQCVRIVASNHELVKQFILRGKGVGMVPSFMIESELQTGKLVPLFPKSKPTSLILYGAARLKRNFTAIQNEFLKSIQNNFKR